MTKIDFVYFDAGGGHRAAATALETAIEREARGWEIRLVDLQEVLRPVDIIEKITGVRLADAYNRMLARGWTRGSTYVLRVLHVVIRLYHRRIVALLERHWSTTRPDLVVSVVPNFNRAMCEGTRRACPDTPYVTVLTDMADYPPHFWIERQEQYLVCGTDRAVEQALALGHSADRVFRTSGMILRPQFYEPVTLDRVAERAGLGMDPSRPIGLVSFGGQGSRVMLQIDQALADAQLILFCGRNERLAAKLRARSPEVPRLVLGFTEEVAYYMHLADYFIGKPGPGSISEAVTMNLPVIVECNAHTLPQERYNAEWVRENGVGVVLESFNGVRAAANELLGHLAEFHDRVARIENRAIFEIPDIFAEILERGP